MTILKTENQEIEVKDGDPIIDAAETLGVPIGCRVGICGACKINILEGAENLSELTQEEKDKDMDRNTRLSCQCHIKQGTVKIQF